jgi:hypothetical protein
LPMQPAPGVCRRQIVKYSEIFFSVT